MRECKSFCPITQALEVFGDRWTLIVVRDIMFVGKRYFRELLDSNEKIASNILADRLSKLEEFGILFKTNDENHKQKLLYTLTPKGIDLMPTMLTITEWSFKYRKVTEDESDYVRYLIEGGKELQIKMQKELLNEYNRVRKFDNELTEL
ncbi:MAG: helix-turn-helix domain-containing protein [Bacteroidota bacterium]